MQVVLDVVILTALEIVLGIDNIIFISILCGKLPIHQREIARRLGLAAAMVTRLMLLFSIKWVMSLTQPVFHLTDLGVPEAWVVPHEAPAREAVPGDMAGENHPAPQGESQPQGATSEAHAAPAAHSELDVNGISVRDLILLIGGLFLIYSSIKEIRSQLAGEEDVKSVPENVTLSKVLVQIAILDIVFSLDSVITAVGLVDHVWVMALAIICAVGVMMFSAGAVGNFVEKNPTIKILALCFLILIGGLLMVESVGVHVPKGYAYTAMAFALLVELINMRVRKLMGKGEEEHPEEPVSELPVPAGVVSGGLKRAEKKAYRVLLATDGSDHARQAEKFLEAFPFGTAPDVVVVHVCPVPMADVSHVQEQYRREGEHLLQETALRCAKWGGIVQREMVSGNAEKNLVRIASDYQTDLIVMGARGHGAMERFVIGSTSEAVSRLAPCSVLIIRPGGPETAFPSVRQVLVGTDNSRASQMAIRNLARFRWTPEQTVTLLSVIDSELPYFLTDVLVPGSDPELQNRQMQDLLQTCSPLLNEAGATVRTAVHQAPNPADDLLKTAAALPADLIVVGSTGQSAWERVLLGSVSQRVLRYAGCSVWIDRSTVQEATARS